MQVHGYSYFHDNFKKAPDKIFWIGIAIWATFGCFLYKSSPSKKLFSVAHTAPLAFIW